MINKLCAHYNLNFRKLLLNKWFLIILGFKVILGTFFASSIMTNGFIPFVNYFVTSGFSSPYDFFVSSGYTEAFPYPPLMLWILSVGRILAIPFLSANWEMVTFGHLFISHIPILLADIFIYLVLNSWLKTKEKAVLWFYWASPVLIFINYFHGQLDVLPMAVLFISLIYLFKQKYLTSSIFLGLGIAIKTHLLAVMPFYLMYLFVKKQKPSKIAGLMCVPIVTFLLIIAPYGTIGFLTSIFGTNESVKVFLLNFTFVHNNLNLLLAPAVLVMLFFNFSAYKKLNKDAFLLILALLFTVFIVFVPPMPGWFYWPIPFFVYFFAKYKEVPKLSFWFMNIAYLLYFTLSQDATFFESFKLVAPKIGSLPEPYVMLEQVGFNAKLIEDGVFTLLFASMIMNTIWIYRMGVKSNLQYKVIDHPLVVGIGGDSGAGKNTLANLIKDIFGAEMTINLEGDDAHKWERGHENWKKYTHLDPKSNNLHEDLRHAAELLKGSSIKRSLYDHGTGTFTDLNDIDSNKVIVYVGLHPFYLQQMRKMFDIKIYVEPEEELRTYWKMVRDIKERGKTKENVLNVMEKRESDAEKFIRPQKKFADIIVRMMLKTEVSIEGEPKLKLQLICDNSIYLEPLLDSICPQGSLKCEHWYEEDLHRQCVEFDGEMTAKEIRKVAYSIIPNLEEITFGPVEWRSNYEGIKQLFFIYYYNVIQSNDFE